MSRAKQSRGHPTEAITLKPSSPLLTAALAGLMCFSTGCRQDKEDGDGGGSNEPEVISTTDAPGLTFAQFSEDCKTRGGLVQTHASCGGASSCKGVSFHKDKLYEHTCKGGNICAGMSCVDLPADGGKTGAELYEHECAGCHAPPKHEGGMELVGHGEGDLTKFNIPVPPGTNLEQTVADFPNKADLALINTIAFGTRGVNNSGSAFSNMPAYHEKISRAETERLVEHIRTLTPLAEEYTVLGEE